MNNIIHICDYTIENIKKLLKIKEVKNSSEAKSLSSLIQDDLISMRKQIIELANENQKQKIEISKLREQLAGGYGFDVIYNVYYLKNGDGPFCPNCAENKGKKNRLRVDTSVDDDKVRHACRFCGSTFCE